MLVLIGLGLYDADDITSRGLKYVEAADKIYLEDYTSKYIKEISGDEADSLSFSDKSIRRVDRHFVENSAQIIIEEARHQTIAFLVVGDPMCATTHAVLLLECKKAGIECRIVNNASIMNAVGNCGLQLYRFGITVSIPFFTASWKPASVYENIEKNMKNNCHTLCLLDIQVKEQLEENLLKKQAIYEQSRYMDTTIAIRQLLELESIHKRKVLSHETKIFLMARVGSQNNEKIVSGKLSSLIEVSMGKPLHVLIICATDLDVVELDFYNLYSIKE